MTQSAPDVNLDPPPERQPRDWEYWAPFAVFMAFVFAGGQFKSWFAHAYVGRTLVVGAMLIWLWKRFTTIRWTHTGLGILFGIIGTVQWIGMECALVWMFGKEGFSIGPLQLVSDVTDYRDYSTIFADPVTLWFFLAVRFLGPVLVVPMMEELFWRDWLWRTIGAPNDYRMMRVGEYDAQAFWVVAVAFAFVHVQFLTAIGWAALVGYLLLKTRSLGACIVMHAVTNFLLGLWVLATWKIIPLEWVPFGVPHFFFW